MCNCKKNKVPATPEIQLNQELNEWKGGVQEIKIDIDNGNKGEEETLQDLQEESD